MNHCPEFLCLLTHATFFEAAIARRMSLSDVVHWAELHVQLRIRTAFAVPGLYLWGFLTLFGVRNRSTGTLGALPPVDLRVVCLVRALAVPQKQAHKWCWGAGSQHCYRSSW